MTVFNLLELNLILQDYLIDMVDNWLRNMNQGKMAGVAFTDLQEAFDTVKSCCCCCCVVQEETT